MVDRYMGFGQEALAIMGYLSQNDNVRTSLKEFFAKFEPEYPYTRLTGALEVLNRHLEYIEIETLTTPNGFEYRFSLTEKGRKELKAMKTGEKTEK